ncbi:hypothetical protein AB0383_16330 [Amycolatopsis sp. NPDC051373]|uniref:hypothetical protein n=1 Tax=Amycolatopsis sp. NPDC051373 TaxID=3155801 RepID=UPI00344B997C
MTAVELAAADLWGTGITPGQHPAAFIRAHLDKLGAIPAAQLLDIPDGTRIKVGGAVTHRQRPATAGGITFLNLEDETGLVNIIVSPGLWKIARQRWLASPSAARARHRPSRTRHRIPRRRPRHPTRPQEPRERFAGLPMNARPPGSSCRGLAADVAISRAMSYSCRVLHRGEI